MEGLLHSFWKTHFWGVFSPKSGKTWNGSGKWLKSGRGSLSLRVRPLHPALCPRLALCPPLSPRMAPPTSPLPRPSWSLLSPLSSWLHMRSHLPWPKITPHLRCPLRVTIQCHPFLSLPLAQRGGRYFLPNPSLRCFLPPRDPPAIYWHFTVYVSFTCFIGCWARPVPVFDTFLPLPLNSQEHSRPYGDWFLRLQGISQFKNMERFVAALGFSHGTCFH